MKPQTTKPYKSLKSPKKADTISPICVKYCNSEIELDEVLDCCMTLFISFAKNTHDEAEAISRMSMNLYKLLLTFDKSKGTPLQLIYKMCKNVTIDMYRSDKNGDNIDYCDGTILDTYAHNSIPDVYINDTDYNDGRIYGNKIMDCVKRSNLIASQKKRYDEGTVPLIKQKTRLANLRELLLEDSELRVYIESKWGKQA